MNGKILVVTTVILAAAILITPVMAIGPFKALDVNNNKNLAAKGPAVTNHRGGEGSGVLFWMMGTSGEHWVKWDFQDAATQAKGIMNNAIIVEGPSTGLPNLAYFMTLGENENKWIYLSGDGEDEDGEDYPGQFTAPAPDPYGIGTHGMLWWFMYSAAWATKSVEVYPEIYAATYPGVYASVYASAYAAAYASNGGNAEAANSAATTAATQAATIAVITAVNAISIPVGIAAGNADVEEHPAGVFWKTNEIKGSLP